MKAFVMDYLDPLGVVVGLLVSIPIVWTWWQIAFGERRQRKKWLAEIVRNPGTRPGVLIVDLLPGKNIHASVRNHLAGDAALATISADRIVSVARAVPLQPEQTADLARDIRAAARRLMDSGVDVVHLFHAGPDVSAMMVGAELSNGPRVLLYHHDQGTYQCFGPLEPLR